MNIVHEMAYAIIGSRDFCGNEREAALDTAADLGIKPTDDQLRQAYALANKTWSRSQKAAGVKEKYLRY